MPNVCLTESVVLYEKYTYKNFGYLSFCILPVLSVPVVQIKLYPPIIAVRLKCLCKKCIESVCYKRVFVKVLLNNCSAFDEFLSKRYEHSVHIVRVSPFDPYVWQICLWANNLLRLSIWAPTAKSFRLFKHEKKILLKKFLSTLFVNHLVKKIHRPKICAMFWTDFFIHDFFGVSVSF